jgi:hypothetical protein
MSGMRLVAGSGRSGTTWVQDALATANALRPVFEPLHPHVSEIGDRYAHRALGADDDHPDLERFLIEVCAGRRNRFWTQYRRQRRWLLPPPTEFSTIQEARRTYRRWGKFFKELPRLVAATVRGDPLVKCIRANLMLGWLSRRIGCRTVLIVRHPGSVIESELRNGWNAWFALERFRRDARLHELTGDRYRSLLARPMTAVEAFAARWVIENQWAVEEAASTGVTVVYYEQLLQSPDREWQRIQVALGLDKAPSREVIQRPSQQSASLKSAAGASIDEPWWMRALSRDQLGQIQGVLDRASVGFYGMSDPRPRSPVESKPIEDGLRIVWCDRRNGNARTRNGRATNPGDRHPPDHGSVPDD